MGITGTQAAQGRPHAENKGRSSEHHLPSAGLLPPSGTDFGQPSSQVGPALGKVLVTNGVLARQPSAVTTALTSLPCLAWLFGAPWPPTEITVVPLSSDTDEINSS